MSTAAAAEASASRVLKESHPDLAAKALACARDDWSYAVRALGNPNLKTYGIGAVASLELYLATGDRTHADKAVELAETITACQQTATPDWDIPLRGFFHRTPARRRIQHYAHIGEIQSPVAALVMLSEILPDHPARQTWLKHVTLYIGYIKAIAAYTAPYFTLPASIYAVDDSRDPRFIAQVKNGVRLNDRYYLRRFPVWFDFRGNYGVLLSQTRAITAAARLLKDRELWDLAQRQLQWVVGRNPFCQSTMYGEGHDFAPQYTATSGDIVGGLPVGIQTSRNEDAPFWPSDDCYNYKEIWVHPSSRWLAIMADLYAY